MGKGHNHYCVNGGRGWGDLNVKKSTQREKGQTVVYCTPISRHNSYLVNIFNSLNLFLLFHSALYENMVWGDSKGPPGPAPAPLEYLTKEANSGLGKYWKYNLGVQLLERKGPR